MRYIPEVLVRGCYKCPFYANTYIDGEECTHNHMNQWGLKLDKNPDIPMNDWIDPDCPLPIKETLW